MTRGTTTEGGQGDAARADEENAVPLDEYQPHLDAVARPDVGFDETTETYSLRTEVPQAVADRLNGMGLAETDKLSVDDGGDDLPVISLSDAELMELLVVLEMLE